MKYLVSFFILLSGLFSFSTAMGLSSAEIDQLIKEGGFYAPESLPVAPQNLDRALAASVRVGSCSGFIISPQGFVITNIHCIIPCLTKSWDYEPQIDMQKVERPGFYSYIKINERVPHRLQCPKHLNPYIYEFDLSDPEVVWIGRGKMTHEESKVTTLSDSEIEDMRAAIEDVVILKFKKRDSRTNTPCLPRSKSIRKARDLLWAVGFPAWAKRPFGRGTNGAEERVSFGRIRASIKEDLVYQRYSQAMDAADQKVFWEREAMFWEAPHLLMTSIDGVDGNSGSMVINQEGLGEAVVFSVSKIAKEENIGGTVFAVRLDHIYDQVKSDLGMQKADKIFSCRSE